MTTQMICWLIPTDENQRLMVSRFSTDAMKAVVNDVEVDGAEG